MVDETETGTEVEANPTTPGQNVEDELDDVAEWDDPDVYEETPEIILKPERIFQPKDWNVFCDDDCVWEEHHLMMRMKSVSFDKSTSKGCQGD